MIYFQKLDWYLVNDMIKINNNYPKYVNDFLYKKSIPGFIFIMILGVVTFLLDITFGVVYGKSAFITIHCITISYFIITALLVLYFLHYLFAYTNKYTFEKAQLLSNYQVIDNIDNDNLNKVFLDDKLIELDTHLKDLDIFFEAYTKDGFIDLGFLFKKNDKSIYKDLDVELLTYMYNHIDYIYNKEAFKLFINDKYHFLKYLFKYNDTSKIEMKLRKRMNKK
jgi:hypothetical protein